MPLNAARRTPHAAPYTFTPTPWLANAHAQTVWAALTPARRLPTALHEDIPLPDGDVLSLVRLGVPAGRMAVLLMPGLEGSIRSPYAPAILAACAAAGWCAVLVHPRGTAGRPNRHRYGYHGGFHADAAFVAGRLQDAGATAVAAVGISLGGNALLTWLGSSGRSSPLAAAVAVCAPFDLGACADAVDRGFSRVYRNHLLADMRRSMAAKRRFHGLSDRDLARLRTFRAFDDRLTAPDNGFAGVEDYYARVSCRNHLGGITVPTAIIHADDDPFVPPHCVPAPSELPPAVTLQRFAAGGHVGFLTGWWPRMVLPGMIVERLRERV